MKLSSDVEKTNNSLENINFDESFRMQSESFTAKSPKFKLKQIRLPNLFNFKWINHPKVLNHSCCAVCLDDTVDSPQILNVWTALAHSSPTRSPLPRVSRFPRSTIISNVLPREMLFE